jgi:tetratricopeptide (TPR) repeat protein
MRRDYWAALALVVVTFAVFARVATFPFVTYDDPDYVTANERVQRGITGEGLRWAFGRLHGEATYWHPLTWLSHMTDIQLFGLRPAGHHLVSLAWHTLNALLVLTLLRRMTGALGPSALVAGLFALHPLQVETVAWIAERKNVLSTSFWLLTTLAYVRYARGPSVGRYALSLGLFALGLMCKPMLVTLPCTLLLLDYWPLRRWRPKAANPAPALSSSGAPEFAASTPWRLVLEKLPLLGLALAVALITFRAHAGLGMTQFDYGLTLGLRVENAVVSYARYLGKVFWPANLSVAYVHPGQWPDEVVLGSLLVMSLLTGLALREWRRRPYFIVGWFWFMGTLVPVIGLVQVGIQAMANRFAYVPLIGLFTALVWGARDWLTHRTGSRHSQVALGAAALAVCAGISSIRLGPWRDSIALFEYALKESPANFVAHNNLAFSYLGAGKFDEALEHAQTAVRLRRDFPQAHYQAGLALEAKHRDDEAAFHLREAFRQDAKWIQPRLALARVLTRQGRRDEAAAELTSVLRIAPDEASAHAALAQLRASEKRPAEALTHYREALRLQPDQPDVLNNLAWLRATHPQAEFRDAAEAVRLASRAVELTKREQAIYLGTLAAAYAQAGRFNEAAATGEEARRLALGAGQTDLAETNRKLTELYRSGKPYREEL